MIVEPDFMDHWKTRLLMRLLEDGCAPLYVLRLWAHCQNRKTHGFSVGSKQWLAGVCCYPFDAKKSADEFHDALVESGFVEFDGARLVVHDWDVANASLIASWNNGRRGGRPRKPNPRVIPQKTHGLTQGGDGLSHGVTDREEKRREDREDVENAAASSGISVWLERFHGCHLDCEHVGEQELVAAIGACRQSGPGGSVIEPDVDEALDAFGRQVAGASRIPFPVREFEKYLRNSTQKKRDEVVGGPEKKRPVTGRERT